MVVETGRKMKEKRITLQWEGTFIELCMGRITRAQKDHIDAHCADLDKDAQSLWYDNAELLKSLFDADNWWSVDDLDHAMGLVFADRSALETKLAKIAFEIDGIPEPSILRKGSYQ